MRWVLLHASLFKTYPGYLNWYSRLECTDNVLGRKRLQMADGWCKHKLIETGKLKLKTIRS